MSAAVRAARESDAYYWGVRFLLVSIVGWGAGLAIGYVGALTGLVLAALLACVIGFRIPPLGLLGMGVSCTLAASAGNWVFTGGLLRYNTFNYWLLVVAIVLGMRLLRIRDAHSRLLALFLALLTVQLIGSPDIDLGVQQIIDQLVIFGLIAYFGRVVDQTEAWQWLGIVCGAVGAGAGALYFYQQVEVNYNAWATCPLTALFAVCLGFRAARGQVHRQTVLLGLASVNAAWLFLSGTRGGLFTGVFSLLYILVELRNVKRQIAFLVVAAVLVSTLAMLFADRQERSLGRLAFLVSDDESLEARTSGRSDLAAGAWRMFRDHPLGIGTGAFPATWATVNSVRGQRRFYGIGGRVSAHSGWMRVLAENGFLGVLLLAGYVSSFAIVGWRRRQPGMFALGAYVTLTLGVALTSYNLDTKGLWFLVAGATVLLNRERVVAQLHAIRPRSTFVPRPAH